MAKVRLDVLLVEKGLAASREKAKTMIMEGNVFINNNREDKPGSTFPEDVEIEIHGKTLQYVSRGGLKLEKAINHFDMSVQDAVCMDIGASTGGFTDCMLQNGAKKVYAVDVGYGQFAWKLRQDERVVCMEKTNIRYVTPDDIGELLDFASCDVSFISLTKVLPVAKELLRDGGEMVCLIKPQFEAGKDKVGKKGVVREKSVHEEVITNVLSFASAYKFTFVVEWEKGVNSTGLLSILSLNVINIELLFLAPVNIRVTLSIIACLSVSVSTFGSVNAPTGQKPFTIDFKSHSWYSASAKMAFIQELYVGRP